MNKNECKIVQDLLVNYVDDLLSKETNIYIEEHLEKCNKCKTFFDNIKNENKENVQDYNIDYLKKYDKELKLFKYTLIILLITLIGMFVFVNVKKYFVFNNIAEKLENYKESDNFYIKNNNYCGDSLLITEIFVSGEELLVKYNSEPGTVIKDGIKYDKYVGEEKWVIDDNTNIKECIDSTWNFINVCIEDLMKIGNVFIYTLNNAYVNGKECYQIITNDESGRILYYDKESGFLVRIEVLNGLINHDDNEICSMINDYVFKFDCVESSVFDN